ncbi:hypothetical protein [Enterovibrio norvegicus]|uniref:hypothetical protein n=1 Tax=Enterovibrio norvegicus TaxID=188144 RepID=UPI003551F392
MITLPTGSPRNKIEFLAKKLHDITEGLKAWVTEQLENAGGQSIVHIPNQLTNGRLGHAMLWGFSGKNFTTFATPFLTNPNHRMAADGWTLEGNESGNDSLKAYWYGRADSRRFCVGGDSDATRFTLRKLFIMPSSIEPDDCMFRMIYTAKDGTSVTLRTSNLKNEGYGTGVSRNTRTITRLTAEETVSEDDGTLKVMTEWPFDGEAGDVIALEIEFEFTGNDAYGVSANIWEIGVFHKFDIPNSAYPAGSEFYDFIFGRNRQMVKAREQETTGKNIYLQGSFSPNDHLAGSEVAFSLDANVTTPFGAANHIMVESLEVVFSRDEFAGSGEYVATCTGGVSIVRMRNGALVLNTRNATWDVKTNGGGAVSNPPAVDFSKLSGGEHATIKALYSEQPLWLSNKVLY